MKNFSHKKCCNLGRTLVQVEPLPIPLVEGKYDGNLEKYFVKLKLCKYPTSGTSDLYEFRMSLFGNGDPEEFFCSCVTSI